MLAMFTLYVLGDAFLYFKFFLNFHLCDMIIMFVSVLMWLVGYAYLGVGMINLKSC